jgi:hypothetical protein
VIIRFRFAALLLCLQYLLLVATLVLLPLSILTNDRQLTLIAMVLGIACIIVVIVQRIVARRALCPLCRTAVLSVRGCSKHRNAKKLMGSHRLHVAVALLARDSFTCPYCHEPSVLEVRARRR